MLKHELPPADRIQDCKLARFVKLPSGTSLWVTLHPDRIARLVEAGPVDTLELRLQITCVAAPTHSQSEGTQVLSRLPPTLGEQVLNEVDMREPNSHLISDTPPPYTSARANGPSTGRPATIGEQCLWT